MAFWLSISNSLSYRIKRTLRLSFNVLQPRKNILLYIEWYCHYLNFDVKRGHDNGNNIKSSKRK